MPVIVLETPIKKMATHHILVPAGSCRLMGGYSVQPASGAPSRKLPNRNSPAGGKSQKLNMLSSRERDVARADPAAAWTRLPKPRPSARE